ncbi:MAG TPA: MmcQ/YjbR family DNA-binding protein [Caulobacteraceae bacterium]|nr:MmcQ/YjbR family DNA-binding protein [Caulobacteraceae bacterium]
MPDADTVRRLALALPEAVETSERGQLAFAVADRGFAWSFMERMAPKKPRVPRPDILAVRCELARKDLLIEANSDAFFDDDHYRGFPAVLVRLARVEEAELASLLESAWRLQAPKRLGGLAPPRRKR